ncbi:MAG: hypothetical protein ACKE51_02960 [Methylococcaceae bacterium]
MNIIFILLAVLLSHSAKAFDTNPRNIKTITQPSGYKTIAYNNRYTFAIPKDYKIKRMSEQNLEFMAIVDSDGHAVFFVHEILITNKLLLNPDGYNLKNYTRRQLLSAIYDKNHLSNDEVNETRKIIFELSNNVAVYKRDGFIFFREDRTDKPKIKTSFYLSKNDDVLTISFWSDNEKLIMNVIQSFHVKNQSITLD